MAAEAAVSSAVQILGDLLIQKVRFLRGVAGEVTWLKDELKRMQGFLKDAADRQAKEERVRIWISEIKEVAEDAQDAIETFLLRVEIRGRYTSFTANLHLYRVGKEIERIRARLEAIDSSRLRYGIQDLGEVPAWRPPENVERRRRMTPDKDVVGLEADVELLLHEAILGERKGLSIAAVVGMGGIGKSTLARMVYNHPAAAAVFECRAWVVVSSEFTAEDIIKQVMLQISSSDDDRLKVLDTTKKLEEALKDKLRREEMLQEMLRRQLEGRRYFIVLDDVWEHAHWESLRSVFPDEQGKSSRLLVTSRNKVFTKYAQYVHDMKLLNPDRSWELFLKKAFIDNSPNQGCPKELEIIGRKILEKCGGLPLAISVVGGLLAEQSHSKIGWEKVLKGISFHLSSGKSSVSAILELSYQNLPAQLKSCFLCFGFFKEDATIPVEKFIHIWIAQGLVPQPQEGEETMEEIATGYLDELINRNMVQVKDMTISNRVKNLHMHDLLRELSIAKAKEEISFEIVREEGSSQCSYKPRHRAMYCSEGSRLSSSTGQNEHIRSLFVHGGVDVGLTSSYWKSFELLRVLDLEGCFLSKLPDTICSLVGLRYLGLRNTGIRKLPRSLGKLKDLLVLDLRGLRLAKTPNYFIRKMQCLRHLYMPGIWCASPLDIRNLKNLQTLSYIYWRDSNTEQVTQMARLCKLGIDMDEVSDVRKLFTSLAALENLVCLKLRRYVCLGMDDGLSRLDRITQLKLVASVRLPSASNFPPNLSYLSLVWTALDEDPMPVLEKLPELVYLKLERAYHGTEFVVSSDGFPKLEALSLRSLQQLRNISVGEFGGMEELKRFEIYDCRKLTTGDLPERLRSTVTLIN